MASTEESLSGLLFLSFLLSCADVPTFRLLRAHLSCIQAGSLPNRMLLSQTLELILDLPMEGVCVYTRSERERAREQERGQKERESKSEEARESACASV